MVSVARLAGVSVSTVSHVINGTRHVEPETHRRVIEAIEKTKYRQDALARAMRRNRTDSIGLIVSDAGEPAFADMVHGVEEEVARLGLTLLLANSAEDPVRESRAVEALLERRVDGLIIARASGSSETVITTLREQGAPFVLMDRLEDLDVDQVAAENAGAANALVDHLVEQGHSRILLVAGDLKVPSLRERTDAFLEAVGRNALAAADQVIVEGPVAVAEAEAAVMEALSREPRPTAVIALSTVLAAGALRACRVLGLAIPRDIAFATFDGFAYSDLFEPHITTVRQPAFQIGVTAMRLLARRLEEPDSSPTVMRLESSIEYGSSTSSRFSNPE